MRLRTLVLAISLVLLIGIVTGVAMQPDDGTNVERPAEVGLQIDGANHPKPLPKVPSVIDLLATFFAAIAAILLLVACRPTFRPTSREPVLRPPSQVVRPVVRRGPPLFS
jgi:hypothetical protein